MQGELKEHEVRVEVTREKDCRKIIALEISAERVDGEKKRIIKELSKRAEVAGFRRGKVPANIIRQRFSDEILSETLKSILPVAYGYAVTKEELKPIGEPVFRDIEADDEGKPLSFVVDIETVPEIEIDIYRGLDVKEEIIKVDETDVSQVLETIRKQHADYGDVDRPVVGDDFVVVDYGPVGLDDRIDKKKRIEDLKIQLGEGQILPEFEKALIGRSVGENGRVEIDYPLNFKPQHLAGKRILYEFKIKEVKERRMPHLNDEFASNLREDINSIDELKADIEKQLIIEKEKEAEEKRKEEALDLIIDENPFDIPLSMVERFREEMIKDDDKRREMLRMGELTEKEMKKREEIFDKIAKRNIKKFFIIDYIGDKEKIEVKDEEINKEIISIAESSDRKLKEVKKIIREGSDKYNDLRNELKERKVFDIILGSGNEQRNQGE